MTWIAVRRVPRPRRRDPRDAAKPSQGGGPRRFGARGNRHAEPVGERLERGPLQEGRQQHREEHDVEEVQALRDGGDHRKRRQDDRDGAPQARPGEHDALAHVEIRCGSRRKGRDGTREKHQHQRENGSLEGDTPQLRGKYEETQHQEHRHLGQTRQPLVEDRHGPLGWQGRAAKGQARQVDAEEAGAIERRGAAVGQRGNAERRDRVGSLAAQPGPSQRLHGEPSDGEPDRQADAELPQQEHQHLRRSKVRLLDPVDEANHEEHRERIVEPGFPLEREADPPFQVPKLLKARSNWAAK